MKDMISSTYVYLIRMLCHEKDGGITCIISICHDLILWDLMYFAGQVHQDSSLL